MTELNWAWFVAGYATAMLTVWMIRQLVNDVFDVITGKR